MSANRFNWVPLICQWLLSCLLMCNKSHGFQSYYVTNSKARSPTRLHEKKLDIKYKDGNKITVHMDEATSSTKHQHHHHNIHHHDHTSISITHSHSSLSNINHNNKPESSSSYFIPKDQTNTILKFGSGEKQKIVNEFGLWCLAMCAITLPPWSVVMTLVDTVCNLQPNLDPNRSFYDYTGKIWSRLYLRLVNSYPAISGDVEWIQNENKGKACLYVANHASWIDIPIVCTVLDPVFKFIAKSELNGVPCIGQQLVGGNHIMIDRDDRRSQLRAFKEGVNYLKNGVPVMAFPEGQRSKDGRLSDFKGGIFSMAVKAKVPIVPISISNAHAVMPKYSLMPIQGGDNKLSVHVHPAIDTEGFTDKELSDRVFEVIASKLPEDQRPLSQVEDIVKKETKIPITVK